MEKYASCVYISTDFCHINHEMDLYESYLGLSLHVFYFQKVEIDEARLWGMRIISNVLGFGFSSWYNL